HIARVFDVREDFERILYDIGNRFLIITAAFERNKLVNPAPEVGIGRRSSGSVCHDLENKGRVGKCNHHRAFSVCPWIHSATPPNPRETSGRAKSYSIRAGAG